MFGNVCSVARGVFVILAGNRCHCEAFWCCQGTRIFGLIFFDHWRTRWFLVTPCHPCCTTHTEILRCIFVGSNRFVLCNEETATLTCGPNAHIDVIQANYGRRLWDTCPNADSPEGYECEHANSSALIFELCDGKNLCLLNASESVFGAYCPLFPHKYIEVDYNCSTFLMNCFKVCRFWFARSRSRL